INLCLMGKTSAFKRPRAPVLQILWGVVNKVNIDYAKRIWEEFTQCSPLHLPYEEAALGYLKFLFKNTKIVRFGMEIPNTLISEDIWTRISHKGRKTKPRTTKLSTDWKCVKRRSQKVNQAKKSTEKSNSKSTPTRVKVKSEKPKQKI
ncbi:hypothetical protein Tco_1157602, partial [Tanacetum coccineum]